MNKTPPSSVDEMSLAEVIVEVAKVSKPDKPTAAPALPLKEGESQMTLFKGKQIRQIFHEGQWFFSVVDVVAAVTESERPRHYWSDLKRQLTEKEDFSELSDSIVQLKMVAPDGKERETDAVNVEALLRIVQSIPSKKAEPFKKWLAKVGYERILETQDPEISVKRAILNWQVQGRTDDWIEARLRSIVVRHELTDQWKDRGVEGAQYGILTNVISKETFDLRPDEHRSLKRLSKNHNLRDHMTDLELVLTMLGEKSTSAIAQATDAQGFYQNKMAAESGGKVAGDARKGLEKKLGHSVVSDENFLNADRQLDPQRLTSKKK